MKDKDRKYWYNELDRFGLLFVGIFIGALTEFTGIRGLGITIGTAGVVCIFLLMYFINKFMKEKQK
jgi:hypothetical protein